MESSGKGSRPYEHFLVHCCIPPPIESWIDDARKSPQIRSAKTDPLLEEGVVFTDSKICASRKIRKYCLQETAFIATC